MLLFFATAVSPTHGYGVYIDYSGPVRVAGLTVRPGDLLAGDQHGVILIPEGVELKELARVAAEIDRLESEIFAICRSKDFSVENLIQVEASVNARRGSTVGPDPLDRRTYVYPAGICAHRDIPAAHF